MERRRAPRRLVAAEEPLSQARLRTGGQLCVLDASSWGALAETTERLLPGRHLDVHVVSSEGRVLVRSRVARAFVAVEIERGNPYPDRAVSTDIEFAERLSA